MYLSALKNPPCVGSEGQNIARVVAIGLLFLLGCQASTNLDNRAGPQTPSAVQADRFFIVDCLLPGQIRQLGQAVTYVSRRQAIKTSAGDCEIRGGEYTAYDRSNYATALKVWLPLAEQGDPAAQNYVGEIFERGLGIAPDYSAAAAWYRRAAEKGYSRAAINLGVLYEKGLGVPKDPKQALAWYRRAAGLGELSFDIVADSQSSEMQRLRDEIAGLRQELKQKQEELDRTQRELQELRPSLEQRRGEAEAERRAVARLRQELEERRKKEQTTTAGLRDLERSLAEREARLAAKDQEVANLRASLTRLEAESKTQRAELTRLQKRSADTGPVIELIEPDLVVTRGIPVARAQARLDPMVVIGRVESAQGILSLTINGREEKLDSSNLFKAQIPVQKPRETVRIVAVDRGGRRATLEFQIPEVQDIPSRPPSQTQAESAKGEQVGYPLPRGISFGNYHALVIGNNDYRMLPQLETAAGDAQEVGRILREKYGFKVTVLQNASRYETLSALNLLRERLSADDNLLIYYAGHGEIDRINQRGHWLPVDAERSSSANWISNTTITDILNAMAVKQLIVVADSCYAGTLTRSALGRLEAGVTRQEALKVMQTMARQRSRMVLTSGGVEPVIDNLGGSHSVFARFFIELLESNTGVLPGQEMFHLIQLRVAAAAQRIDVRQVPEYAPIKFAGHESGDFFFARAAN